MENNLFLKINEIREKADIVDVLSRYVNVIPKGKSHKALCPFHNDNDPSLSISREKQIFNCFVCHEKGNVFSFVQKFKKIPYMQAVKEVADMVGVEFKLNEKKEQVVVNPKVQVLYDLLKDACMFYMNNLNANQNAIDYCKNRNMSSSILNEFKIGFSSSSDSIIQFLQAKGYSKEDIYRSGIAFEENGSLKDRFVNRLIFPITDLTGHIVAFSGRIIEKVDLAKYSNSPETEIFTKGNTLYHFATALEEIKKNKKMYVCEGFMDCIALCKAGLKNSVALMGTAFTKEHLRVLKYLGVKIVLCLDGDIPGNVNANKLSNELVKLNISHEIVPGYDDVKDLDEYLNKYGEIALVQHVESKTMNSFDFNIHVAKRTTNLLNNNEDKKEFLKQMAAKLAKMEEADVDIYVNRLHDELGFSTSTIRNLIKANHDNSQGNVIQAINEYKKLDKFTQMQLRVLSSMLDSPEAIQKFIDSEVFLTNNSYRKLSGIICEYYQANVDNFSMDHLLADLYTQVESEYSDDIDLKETLGLIDDKKEDYPSYSEASFNDLIFNLKEIQPLEDRFAKIQENIKFASTLEEKNDLIRQSLKIKTELNNLRRKG